PPRPLLGSSSSPVPRPPPPTIGVGQLASGGATYVSQPAPTPHSASAAAKTHAARGEEAIVTLLSTTALVTVCPRASHSCTSAKPRPAASAQPTADQPGPSGLSNSILRGPFQDGGASPARGVATLLFLSRLRALASR